MSVVGIDLGTTNTVVACVRNQRVHVLADDEGRRLLPSVVSFHPNGDVLVGAGAKERRLVDAKNTVSSVKRLIGRSWQSPELARSRERFAFEMKEGPGHAPLVVSRGNEYTLPEISAFVLKRAKQIGEAALGDAVEKAVITVPANFNELQRASTKVAGRVAGLEVLRILNEPTAAALAYGFGRGGHERIAVYDFGGGTFDCTLLDLSGNVFEVLATAGDTFLGGDDLDTAIAERMGEAFLMQHRFDPRQDPQTFERLRVHAELIKIELSSQPHSQVHLREMAFGVGGAHLDLRFGLTRSELEAITEPYLERTLKVCQEALALAGLPVSSFDKVILVGGTTRIPLVRQRVEQFFGTAPLDRINPDEVVGIGAAIQAAALTDFARRRSIPAPPPPSRQKVSTLRGMNAEAEAARGIVHPDAPQPAQAPEPPATPVGRVALSRASTQRMPGAPMPPRTTTQRYVRPPSPSRPEIDRDEDTQTQPRAPTPSIPDIGLDIDPDKEITRSVQMPAPSAASAARAAPFDELADTYGQLPATRPTIPPPPASDMLTNTMPTEGSVADLSPTVRGSIPAMPATDDPDEDPPTRPGPQLSPRVPTPAAARPPSPAPPPLPVTATQPMRPAPSTQPMHAAPLPTPAPPPVTFAATSHAPPIFPTPTPGAAFPVSPPLPPPPHGQPMPPSTSTAPLLPQPARASETPRHYSAPPPSLAPILVDVTPRALVVETAGGFCDTIIPRNAKIPCERTRGFSPGRDYQTAVRIRVAQGEDPAFERNTYLGELELSGLRSAPRGEVTIAVTFEVDVNGIVQVRATDTATGREARAVLQLVGVAQEEAIALMVERAGARRVAPTIG